MAATPTGHTEQAGWLSNLGATLLRRFERVGDLADLDAAVEAGRAAVAATPTGHPDQAMYLSNLGDALQTRFERVGEPVDAQTALDAWRKAAAVATAPVSARIRAGRSLGALAASQRRWPDTLDGYATAVGLLPLLVWRGVSRPSSEQLLAGWSGLAVDAAACAIAANRPDQPLQLLERGRGVLWSQLLEIRTDLHALREAHPDLAVRLDTVRADLNRPTPIDATADPGSTGSATDLALAHE